MSVSITDPCRVVTMWSVSVWTGFPFLTAAYAEERTNHTSAASMWVCSEYNTYCRSELLLQSSLGWFLNVFFHFCCNSPQTVWYRTPTIYSMSPVSGLPGTALYLYSNMESILNFILNPLQNHCRHLGDNTRTDLLWCVWKQHCQELQWPQRQISAV